MRIANSIEHNGDGNPKLIGFSSNKESKVNLSSAIFDNRALALLTGQDIVTGANEVFKREVVIVNSGTATLEKTPKGEKLESLWIMGVDGIEDTELLEGTPSTETGEYSLSTKTIDVHDSIADDTKLVAYYKIDADATAQTIIVSSDKFPASFKLIMEVLVSDFYTKKLYPAQIVIPSCKMEDNWSLSFEPDGDPQALELPIEILKPANSNDMWKMTIYDDKALA